jgi:hypothetical protein
MLRRVRPEKIAAACTTYFRPAWQQLLREIDHLEAPGG